MICKKENKKWTNFKFSTRGGVPLHSHLTLAHYGVGTLFQNWKLSLVVMESSGNGDFSRDVNRKRSPVGLKLSRKKKGKLWGMDKLDQTNYVLANRFILSCFTWLEKNDDIHVEGIFRKAGHEMRIQELKRECSRLGWVPCDTDDVHDIASLVKRFLREMQEPLLTFDLYTTFLGNDSNDLEEKLSNIQTALLLLPQFNRLLLETLARYLKRLCSYSKFTKMTSENLAIVIGPNILKPRVHNPIVLISDAAHVSEVVQHLIERVDFLFSQKETVLEGLAEKAFRLQMRRKYSWHRLVSRPLISDVPKTSLWDNEATYMRACIMSKQIHTEVVKHLQEDSIPEARELQKEKEEHERLQDVPLLLAFMEDTLPFKFLRVMLTPNHTPEYIIESVIEEFGIKDICADQLALFTFDNDKLEPDVPLLEYGFGVELDKWELKVVRIADISLRSLKTRLKRIEEELQGLDFIYTGKESKKEEYGSLNQRLKNVERDVEIFSGNMVDKDHMTNQVLSELSLVIQVLQEKIKQMIWEESIQQLIHKKSTGITFKFQGPMLLVMDAASIREEDNQQEEDIHETLYV
eukprot:TRINITY_DN11965_c0_g1_i9.p1 TRINITY_DN11965_c0_g1~~TRINITY_DN11965_c0_g1_i9.p1  ORF type:complete len:577 (+),score=140.89 TRINITY_DN11965_c0_g1_i9:1755-3485(+)